MEPRIALLSVLLFLTSSSDVLARSKREYVVTTENPSSTVGNSIEKDVDSSSPQIYEMRIDTNVSNRYAKTLITSKVRNFNSKAQEVTFSIVTPDKAFISGFTMEIDGKQYEAYVKEKEEAKKTYDQAVASGIGAAHVAVSARDSNRFTVSVNVEPQSKATFYLRYEELLVRTSEKYELVLNIHPGQPVKNFGVVVNIIESRPLKFVKVPSLRSGNEIAKNNPNIDPEADIQNVNVTSAIVTFKPDIVKQKLLANSLGGKEENGLSGQLVVQYDVERDPQGGEVLVDGGFFVHFFAPEDLTPLKKQVVFVLDTSGSMSGRRITQLKEAMNSILGELNPEDVISIIEFNSAVSVWNIDLVNVTYREGMTPYSYFHIEQEINPEQLTVLPESFAASADTIKKAKEVVGKLDAYGGTDIQTALQIALKIVAKNKNPQQNQPIIVFLTDGEPTVGEVYTEKIISTITELNVNKVPIFSLSFGEGADREFLQKLSLKNQGFARHIYEAADANLQLENFYQQISSPLLANVTFKYVDKVQNVTRKYFPILFRGSELYTAGIIDPGFAPPNVEGWGIHGPIILKPKVYQAAGSLERLWAYLTVRQLLEQREVAKDKEPATRDALALALKYSFVTDVTSLVVVKPNATSAVDTEDASKVSNHGFANKIQPLRTVGAIPMYSSAVAAYGGAISPTGYSGGPATTIRLASFGGAGFQPGPPAYPGFPQQLHLDRSSGIQFGPQQRYFYNPPYIPKDLGRRHKSRSRISTFIRKESDITLDSVDVDYDSMVKPAQLTTTPPLPQTTENVSWLNDILENNRTVTIDNKTYSFGLNETLGTGKTCSNSVNNTDGQCMLIHECKIVHSYLTDLENYKKYFCEQKSYAGVCCPTAVHQP